MYIRTSRKSAKTCRAVARLDGNLLGKRKEGAVEKPEGSKGHSPGAGRTSDQGGGAGLRACTERNWHCGNVALVTDYNHLTGNVHVVGERTAYVLGRKVMSEWKLSGGGYEKELKTKGRIAREPLMVSQKLYEENGEGLGPRVFGWEHHELRKS